MNKIDVAVLGLGGMGTTHVNAAKASPYVDKVYGYEPDQAMLAQKSKELNVIGAGLDEIMKNPAIKLVYIASVNEVHAEQAIMALKAGKSVLCEKPMGMTMEEARKIIAVEKESANFLQIGFELHYSKMYSTVKNWIQQGLIGTPVLNDCRYYCCEFHKKNTWRSNSTGSFLIGEKLSHYLDLQRWFFDCPIESVYSLSAPNVVEYFKHRDNHHIMTKYQNGKVATLNFIMYIAESHHEDPLRETLEKQSDDGHFLQYYICGTKGAIETDVFRRRIRRWAFEDGQQHQNIQSKIVETISFPKEEDLEWFHNTHGQNMRIAELVAKGMKPEVSASDAYETMKLCFAAELSENENRVVKFSELK